MKHNSRGPEDESYISPVGKINPKEGFGRVYNLSLLLAFVANLFQMIGISLLFRYSDFIQNLGGTEWELGWVIGVSSVGAIVFRLVQGPAVDRLGPSTIWLLSIVGQLLALAWHLKIDSVNGLEIFLARTLFATSVAGNFGAWLSFVSLQSPANRIAEVIGVVGASGFLGMAIGPTIGDLIFSGESVHENVRRMFQGSMISIFVALFFAVIACWIAQKSRARLEPLKRGELRRKRPANVTEDEPAGVFRLMMRYQPGWLLAVGMLMGMSIGFPTTYVRPFAEAGGIEQIKIYFITYNVVAFISRILFRRTPQLIGLKPTILLGLGFMAASMPLYLLVDSQTKLWIPAVLAGLGHSFLFPSVVAGCNIAFPQKNRGVATNLILSMFDFGVLLGMPLIGYIVTVCRKNDWPAYPSVFTVLVFLLVAIGFLFFVDRRFDKLVEEA